MLLVANLANINLGKRHKKRITETLAYGYPSESTQPELSNEFQHDRVYMVFKILCVFWTRVASALEGLRKGTPQDMLVIAMFECT